MNSRKSTEFAVIIVFLIWKQERAFTVVEMLAAIIILGLIFTSFMTLYLAINQSYYLQQDEIMLRNKARNIKTRLKNDILRANEVQIKDNNQQNILMLKVEKKNTDSVRYEFNNQQINYWDISSEESLDDINWQKKDKQTLAKDEIDQLELNFSLTENDKAVEVKLILRKDLNRDNSNSLSYEIIDTINPRYEI